MRKPTFDEISSFNEYRANHVALVQKLGKAALDMDFSDHDHDKIEATGKDQELLALRFLDKKGKIKVSDEDKNTLRKVSAKHALNSKHHAEYWDTEINIRNFNEEDKNVIHATNMPKRYIAEMACDWSACALYHNEPIFKWFNKVINKYLFFTDNQIEYLEDCLKKIVKSIGKDNISFPGVRYTATQVPPKDWKNEKLEEASEENKPKLTDINKAKDILKDEILDDQNLSLSNDSLKKPGINKDQNIFSGIVKPKDDFDRKVHYSQAQKKAEELVNDNNSNLISYDILTGQEAKNEGFTFDSNVSDHTPVMILQFNDPNLDDYFKIALGFKDRADQKLTSEQTKEIEKLTAKALCLQLSDGNIPENFFEREFKYTNPKQLESWKQSILLTAKGLDESGYFNKGSEYVICRTEDIFYKIGPGKVEENTSFRGNPSIYSIHELIDSLVKKRKDIFNKGYAKDSWNPSDIYAIENSYYEEFYNRWSEMMKDYSLNRNHFNAYLKTCLVDKKVIGISLKKLGETFEIEDINVSDDTNKGARILSEPEIIYIPDIFPFIGSRNKIKTRTGLSFSCKSKTPTSDGIVDLGETISFSYRRFTDGLSMSLELTSNKGESRIGKTPVALVNDFKEENNIEMSKLNGDKVIMDFRNGKHYTEWAKQAARNLRSEDILQKVRFISGEDSSNSNPIKIGEPNGIIFNEDNWKKYAMSITESDLFNSKNDTLINKVYIWPKLIDMLYALSYSRASGRMCQDLNNIYDWSKKRGSIFAPYILVH